jgi:hypothetical protein
MEVDRGYGENNAYTTIPIQAKANVKLISVIFWNRKEQETTQLSIIPGIL